MKFGLHLGTRGAALNPDSLLAIVQKLEKLKFGHLGISDHLIIANKVVSPYPYTKSRVWFAQDTGECLDQLTTLAFVAGSTQRIGLLTSVMVIPHRPLVLTAKMLATADILSKGRLIVGVGVGWMQEEMELLGAPTFSDRGKLSDECLSAMKLLWTEATPEFDGQFVTFRDLKFEPKPVQKPHPPIWVGGETRPARRRAGRVGDGWYPVGNNPSSPYDTAERFSKGVSETREFAEKAGRNPAEIDIALNALWFHLGNPLVSESGERMPFTGNVEAVLDDIGAYRLAGLQHLIIGFESDDVRMTLDKLDEFAELVMSKNLD